ncbi:MAG: hypothetical protein K0S61_4826 [Anaerocolumna sp.]|jgi:hypothetical protein|nr:hypothetical protein [Anaerocolumna sp.]
MGRSKKDFEYVVNSIFKRIQEVIMEYKIEVFSRLYPVLNDFLYHYISYKELHTIIEDLPGDKEFWVRSCDAHLKVAATSWCMAFGSKESNQTHWKNLFEQNDKDTVEEFREYILQQDNSSAEQWASCWTEMVSFRNQYIVHRELKFNNSVPYFDFAYKVTLWFDLWIREKIKPDFLDFETFDRISLDYHNKIRDTLIIVRDNSK